MAWTKRTLPGGAVPGGIFGGNGRWLVPDYNSSNILLTDDFTSFITVSGAFVYPDGASKDDSRWYLIDDAAIGGFYRSTDGLVGSTWERVNCNFRGGAELGPPYDSAYSVLVLGSGRIAVVFKSATDTYGISTSDDGGATWTIRHTSTAATNVGIVKRLIQGGPRFFAVFDHFGVGSVVSSADNGATWASVPSPPDGVDSFAVLPDGIIAASGDGDSFFSMSSDLGVNWSTVPDTGAFISFYGATTPAAAYMFGRPSAASGTKPPQVFYNTGAGWLTYPTTGVNAAVDLVQFQANFAAANDLVVFGTPHGTESGLWTATAIEYVPPIGGSITAPLRLEVQASAALTAGLRMQVGVTGAALSLPARLSVIADGVLGGLNGAGGWPSAPLGRWRSVVMLDGVDVSAQTVGEIVIQHADNEARTMQFSFRPATVLQPMSIIGRRVQAYFAQLGDSGEALAAQLMFTGILETPTINMQSGVISCSCHDQMQEIFANTPRAWIDANVGGRWREEVSGEAADNFDYLEARRLSVPVSIALDVQQQPVVLPWRDGLAAETIQAADMLDNTLSVDLPSRDELRTRITCRLQYRFERLRGRAVVAQYANGLQFYIGAGALEASKLWLTTAMVKQSVEGLRGWTVESLAIENPTPGTYDRGPAPGDGVYVISPSVAPDLALGFEAKCSTRWQQTVTQDYTVDVVLPSLEASIGRVVEEIGATFDVPFDVRDWGTDDTVLPVLTLPTVGDVVQEWKPVGQQDADRDEVLRTLLDQAWVKLWDSSRSGRVRFALPLRPNLWLNNFVTVATASLNASGKVVEIEHRMDPETGEAITTAAIAVGLPGATGASLPTWTLPATPAIDDTRPPETYSFEIGTFVGGDGASVPFDEETMIGFSTNQESPDLIATNFYPHQLSIRAPDVEALDRDPLELEAVVEIATSIPTDLLELL